MYGGLEHRSQSSLITSQCTRASRPLSTWRDTGGRGREREGEGGRGREREGEGGGGREGEEREGGRGREAKRDSFYHRTYNM